VADEGGDTKTPALLVPILALLLLASAFFALRTEKSPQAPETMRAPTPPAAPERAPLTTPGLEREAGVRDERPAANPPASGAATAPHPLTPEHARLFRENQLFAAISSAVDQKDAARLRALLQAYAQEYPEDPQQVQRGFAVIADCIERPGEAATAAARAYDDRNRGSLVRRHLRRHCFERP
jgi:hypothetical protein